MDRTHVSVDDPGKETAFTRLETITAFAVVGILALALGLIALTMPANQAAHESIKYHQSGTFGYTASASAGSVYGPEGLVTGEPILGDQAGPVTARFDYHFSTPAQRKLRGSSRMVATVHAGGLTREFTVADPASFSGAKATVSGLLPMGAMLAYVHRAEAAVGAAGVTTSTVVVTPKITVRGTVDEHRLTTSFAPALSFDVDGSSLRPTQPMGAADPSESLKPSKTGKLDFRTTASHTMPLLLVHPAVSTVRAAGLGLGVGFLLVALWLARPLLRSGGPRGEATRIRALYGSRLVDVRTLSLRDGPVADVTGIDALAEISKRYESMILHVSDPEAYLVWDNGMLYRYRPVTALRPVAEHAAREA